jgi:probable rRNA maturation factor
MLSRSSKSVHFFFDGVKLTLGNRKELKAFVISIFKDEKRELDSISYIFSTDKTVHNINKKFLNHDFLTDIITFNLSENPNSVVAEAYISVDRVKENALLQKEVFQKELHRVIFHGALHVCGYDDKSRAEKKRMRTMEEHYLQKYFG